MHIISRKALKGAGETYAAAGNPLDSWYRVAKSAAWGNLEDVRKTYASVVVGEKTYTVFNIGGNKFRLVVGINYKTQKVFIKHVLTHAEYEKGDWKK